MVEAGAGSGGYRVGPDRLAVGVPTYLPDFVLTVDDSLINKSQVEGRTLRVLHCHYFVTNN